MMTVEVGGESKPIEDATEQWIAQGINKRYPRGAAVCVRVRIWADGVDVVLSTPDCLTGAGGGRRANEREMMIIALWEKRGLLKPDYTAGDVIAFLKQVDRYI